MTGDIPRDYQVRDVVQYWSVSKARFVDGVVEARREDGGAVVYDLNCKKGMPAAWLRKPPHFDVAEEVEYWSSIASRWVPAKVVNIDVQQRFCDLDIKAGALLGRLRKARRFVAGPAEEQQQQGLACEFKMGDRVQYWSQSKARWLEASVRGMHATADLTLYDLDCKRGIPAERLRRCFDSGPAFCVGDKVEYWSISAGRWLPARVLRLETHLGQCDLNVKQGAALGRLRHVLRPGSAATAQNAASSADTEVRKRMRSGNDEIGPTAKRFANSVLF